MVTERGVGGESPFTPHTCQGARPESVGTAWGSSLAAQAHTWLRPCPVGLQSPSWECSPSFRRVSVRMDTVAWERLVHSGRPAGSSCQPSAFASAAPSSPKAQRSFPTPWCHLSLNDFEFGAAHLGIYRSQAQKRHLEAHKYCTTGGWAVSALFGAASLTRSPLCGRCEAAGRGGGHRAS